VPLPTNVTVDLSNTSQALNNLPSYSRVSGVTALATQSTLANGGGYLTGFGSVSSQNSLAFGGAYLTGFGAVASQSSLAYGGGYLTGFGVLASQSTVNLASQITGSLANSNVSGLGALALLGSVALDGAYVTNNLAANRIGAGTIAAGIIYAGDVAASQITSGYIAAARINAGSLTVDKLGNSYVPGTSNHVSFSMGAAWSSGSNYAGGIYLADSTAYFPLLAYNNGNGYALAAATTDTAGTYSAVVTWGGWNGNTTAPTYATSAYLTSGIFGGKFVYGSDAQVATLGTASYAGKFAYGATYDAVLGDSVNGIAGRFRAGASGAYTRSVSLCDGSYAVNIDNGTLRYGAVTIAVPPNNTSTYLRGDGTWKRIEKVSDGTATGTWVNTTKPGSGSTNGWAVLNISGTDYYIPVWT
jgi:hypothetical protein